MCVCTRKKCFFRGEEKKYRVARVEMFWDKPGDILFMYMYNNSTLCGTTILSDSKNVLCFMGRICLVILEMKELNTTV